MLGFTRFVSMRDETVGDYDVPNKVNYFPSNYMCYHYSMWVYLFTAS